MRPSRSPLYAAIIVALFVGFLYLPAIKGEFLQWDDDVYVYENPSLHPLDAEYIKYAFTTVSFSNYHPLTLLSYSLDMTLWGMIPFGFHLTNIILHMLNTFLIVLLAWWLMKISGNSWSSGPLLISAALTGILFGAHPLHVESVAWISERKDMLYSFFYILAIMSYLSYTRQTSRWGMYMLSIALGLLSMLSKPMAITLPAVLLILDYYPLRRMSWATTPKASGKAMAFLLMEKLPYAAPAAALSYVTIKAQGVSISHIDQLYLDERLLNAIKALGFYLRKFILPTGLAPLYSIHLPIRLTALEWAWAVVVLLITLYCLRVVRKKPLLPAVWAWYLVSIAPVLGIMQVGRQYAADRYTYMPLLGLMLLAGLSAGWLWDRAERSSDRKRLAAVIALSAVLVAGMSVQTVRQIGYWKDSGALWNREASVFPQEPYAYYKLGHVAMAKGDMPTSVDYFTEALDLNPVSVDPLYSRGMAYFFMGDYRKALSDFDMVLMLKPGHKKTLSSRDTVLRALERKRQEEAGGKN